MVELFGTDEHKVPYLKPLLAGDMASAFAPVDQKLIDASSAGKSRVRLLSRCRDHRSS